MHECPCMSESVVNDVIPRESVIEWCSACMSDSAVKEMVLGTKK